MSDLDEALEFIWQQLTGADGSDPGALSDAVKDNETFAKIAPFLGDLRALSAALNRGDLDENVGSKGYVLSNLKGLQANLRHLTWQTKKIAEGDFRHKVDFLGDFSESFNEMTAKLDIFSEKLKMMAHFDELTKLPNRHFLSQFLETYFNKYTHDHERFSVMMIDIDLFKNVNDLYGHDAGDKVLVQLSALLNAKFRTSDVVARYGGEEFLAVLINTSAVRAQATAERIRKAVEQAEFTIAPGSSIRLTVSIGISETADADPDYEAAVKRSDEALYRAKRSGRNRVAVKRAGALTTSKPDTV